jgi:Leucine-rich repeat (LRR) protein
MLEVRLDAPQLKKLEVIYCQIERVIAIRGCPKLTTLNISNTIDMKVGTS